MCNASERPGRPTERSHRGTSGGVSTPTDARRGTIAVTGASGLIGSALVRVLRARKVEVITIGRGKDAALRWDVNAGVLDAAALEGVDAIVHLAGAPIDVRWTAKAREEIRRSRVQSTQLLARTIASLTRKPSVFVCGSAVGFYGNGGNVVLSETSASGGGFLAGVVREWEASAAPVANDGVRVVNIRTGVVISGHGGMIRRLKLPFQLGLGGVIGNGSQWISWISLHDHVRAVQHVLGGEVSGPVNLVAPYPATNRQFTHAFGRALRRPTVLRIPAFALRAFYGQMATETILVSQRAVPSRLVSSSFVFETPDIDSALQRELHAPAE